MKRSRSLSTPPPSDFWKPRPKQRQGEEWQDGLTRAMSDPEQIFEQDELTVTLLDAFPKARYHFLIVPREDINTVKDLSKKNLELLNHIHSLAEQLIERVHEKEPDLPFRFGYHAVPSLRRLHLHIISQDFTSPKMRTPHHWNTFNTDYFMDSSLVIDTLKRVGHVEVDKEKYEAFLTHKMKCNQCAERFEHWQMPKLKKHLIEHSTSRSMPQSGEPSKRRKSCMY